MAMIYGRPKWHGRGQMAKNKLTRGLGWYDREPTKRHNVFLRPLPSPATPPMILKRFEKMILSPMTRWEEQIVNQDGVLRNDKWGLVFGDMPSMVLHYLQKMPLSLTFKTMSWRKCQEEKTRREREQRKQVHHFAAAATQPVTPHCW